MHAKQARELLWQKVSGTDMEQEPNAAQKEFSLL